MEIIRLTNKEAYKSAEKVIGVIGQFDGLHIGHLALIEEAKSLAKTDQAKVAVMTFDPHPDFILRKRPNMGYITPLKEKLNLLENIGVDKVIIIHFDEILARTEPEDFFNQYLSSLYAIVVGEDYHYGYKGQGNVASLQASGKKIIVVPEKKYHDVKIGSEQIRSLLMEGKVEIIEQLLHRNYNISGIVRHGSKIGRTLGIKTANIDLDDDYQVMKKGVYGVLIHYNNRTWQGIGNIGNNPSLNYIPRMRLEVHLFDFDEDLYGKIISVDFLFFVREELIFADKEDLILQIKKDVMEVKRRFANET